MARKTKTFRVDDLRLIVNRRLRVPDSTLYMKAPGKDRDMTPAEAFRLGQASLLEEILHLTGNYNGFNYQEGVIDFTTDPPSAPGDETRRIYY